jgi:anti-sigma factor RsiW
MSCERVEDLLVAYADGELESAERARVEEHLRGCPRCRALLETLRDADSVLAAFPEVEPGPELRARLLAIPSRRPLGRRVFALLLRPSLQPFYAAATILFGLISLYLLNPNRASIERAVSKGLHRGYSQVERLYARAGSVTGSVVGFAENVVDSFGELRPARKSGD